MEEKRVKDPLTIQLNAFYFKLCSVSNTVSPAFFCRFLIIMYPAFHL